MKALLCLSSIALLVVLLDPASAQNSAETRATLIDLAGVSIYVEPPAKALEEKGMTDFVLEVEVERRLKEAGVPVLDFDIQDPPPGMPTLYLEVTAVIDEAVEQISYAIRLELTQSVRLERDPTSDGLYAPTWSVGGVGVYAKGWREAIIDDVLSYTDQFINAYFSANPDAKP
ncbi:MAG: hypothetical protein OEN01_02935 [Candidatus Krumholzibacteria bacterium]|nr:hypothetical protein [Candidatus Krumholzibacteria bacterium]